MSNISKVIRTKPGEEFYNLEDRAERLMAAAIKDLEPREKEYLISIMVTELPPYEDSTNED